MGIIRASSRGSVKQLKIENFMMGALPVRQKSHLQRTQYHISTLEGSLNFSLISTKSNNMLSPMPPFIKLNLCSQLQPHCFCYAWICHKAFLKNVMSSIGTGICYLYVHLSKFKVAQCRGWNYHICQVSIRRRHFVRDQEQESEHLPGCTTKRLSTALLHKRNTTECSSACVFHLFHPHVQDSVLFESDEPVHALH